MGFCSLVYNEFLVLYFCGLEKNTYIEIARRSRLLSMPLFDIEGSNFPDDNNDNDNYNDNDNEAELGINTIYNIN